jgi:hypothetical protein
LINFVVLNLNKRARERIALQKANMQIPDIEKAAKVQEAHRKIKVATSDSRCEFVPQAF